MTTNHLPECFWGDVDEAGNIIICICQELRACEQRVRESWYEVQSETWEQGFKYALDAAREAVVPQNVRSAYLVSLSPQEQRIAVSALELAARAIDALRNPPSLPPTTGRAHKY